MKKLIMLLWVFLGVISWCRAQRIETVEIIVSNSFIVSEGVITQPSTVQTINTNDTITANSSFVKVVSAGGDLAIANDVLQISTNDIDAGYNIIIMGTDNTNRIELHNGDGLVVQDGVSFSLGENSQIGFIFNGAVWVEVFRMDSTI